MRHETPEQVATLLARYAPKKVRSVLDPAAGSGVLARPFFKREDCKHIQLLDVDSSVIAELKLHTTSIGSVLASKDDFLRWSASNGNGYRKRFDCIVMNPPFAGKLQDYVHIQVPGKYRRKKVSIEAAFRSTAWDDTSAFNHLLGLFRSAATDLERLCSGFCPFSGLTKLEWKTGKLFLLHFYHISTFGRREDELSTHF